MGESVEIFDKFGKFGEKWCNLKRKKEKNKEQQDSSQVHMLKCVGFTTHKACHSASGCHGWAKSNSLGMVQQET